MLNDGRVITVEREEVTCCGSLAEPGGASRGESLDYPPLKLRWEKGAEYPLISFDIIDGVPWMAAGIVTARLCVGQPPNKLAATYFKWNGKAWLEVPEEEFPLDRAKANLLIGGPNPRNENRYHVPVDQKLVGVPPDTVRGSLTRRSYLCDRFQH